MRIGLDMPVIERERDIVAKLAEARLGARVPIAVRIGKGAGLLAHRGREAFVASRDLTDDRGVIAGIETGMGVRMTADLNSYCVELAQLVGLELSSTQRRSARRLAKVTDDADPVGIRHPLERTDRLR